MKPTRDPVTGAQVFRCSSGHGHRVRARMAECEARPDARKSARRLFGTPKPEAVKSRVRAEAIIRRICGTIGGASFGTGRVWGEVLASYVLNGTPIEPSDYGYELGAHHALEMIARWRSDNPAVIAAELRALALEAAMKADNPQSIDRITRRASALLSVL